MIQQDSGYNLHREFRLGAPSAFMDQSPGERKTASRASGSGSNRRSIPTPFGTYRTAPREDPDSAAPRKRQLILVLDSDARSRRLTTRVLNQVGFATRDARTCQEADDQLRAHAFDLVIAEINPDAPATVHWMVHLLQTTTTPAIALGPVGESALGVLPVNLAGYLPKPIDFTALGRLVAQLLK